VSRQKQLEDQLTDNGTNNQPSWDGSFKPTLLKHSTKRRLPCTALTYPKSANTSGLPLRKYQTEEVSNLCTTQHPLARGVGDGAVLHWFVHLDGHESRGSDDEMAIEEVYSGHSWDKTDCISGKELRGDVLLQCFCCCSASSSCDVGFLFPLAMQFGLLQS
jgi:hypothetical protein